MPSFIRLSLESMDDEFYFEQFLFHLQSDGEKNHLWVSCNREQRDFIFSFVEYVILNHSEKLDYEFCADQALRVQAIWARA